MKARSALAALLVSALAACHSAPSPTTPSTIALRGHVQLDGGTQRGKLGLAWLTAEEAARWERHDLLARDFAELFQRFTVEGPLELGAEPRPYNVRAPAGARVLAVFDPGAHFFTSLFTGDTYAALSSPSSAELRLAPAAPRKLPACEGPRFQAIYVDEPGVRGSIGNDTRRRFCARLPRSYATDAAKRYPIVLLLPGFESTDMAYLGSKRGITDAADRIADETGHELILVGVDTSTKTGSTYLVDSPITGRFDSFLAGPALTAIEAQLRTLGTRDGRALVGHSTGGFNAISFGLRHGELFCALGASSPDGLDLDRWLLDEQRVARPSILAWVRLDAAVGFPGQMSSYAADWSPRDDGRVEWPVDLRTGRATPAMKAWSANGPAALVDALPLRDKLAAWFTDRIFISIAEHDEFGLMPPARAFAEKLQQRGLRPTFVPTGGGHFEGSRERIAAALSFVAARLEPAR